MSPEVSIAIKEKREKDFKYAHARTSCRAKKKRKKETEQDVCLVRHDVLNKSRIGEEGADAWWDKYGDS
jgi:hypothetical protein